MPTSPNTALVLSTLQSIGQGLQVNNATFFASSSVLIGAAKDVTNLVPLLEVRLGPKDKTKRYSTGNAPILGGKIDDSQNYTLEITLDYTNAEEVEAVTLPAIRDSLTEKFHATIYLGLQNQVAYSGLEGDGQYGFAFRNGQQWRVYKQILHVRYEYSVIVQP